MERDALTAGVARGGLVSTADIKVLICYLLSTLKTPVPAQKMADTLHLEGVANYFEISDAFTKLEQSGHISLVPDKDDNLYVITLSGADVAKTLLTSVPYSVREKAYKLSLRMMARYKNEHENNIFIEKTENGYIVNCSVLDGANEMMTVRLVAADSNQADMIKQAFLNDASNIYSSIIEIITNVKSE